MLSLLVEDDFEGASIIVNLEYSAHGLLEAVDDSASNDYIVDGLAIDLTNVVRTRTSFLDHSHGDWRKNSGLTLLSLIVISTEVVGSFLTRESVRVILTHLLRHEESSVVACELSRGRLGKVRE